MAGFPVLRSIFFILHFASGPSSAFVVKDSSSTSHCRQSKLLFATKATKGSIVEIDCTLRPEGEFVPEILIDGIVLDEYHEPRRLKFCLGQGNYLPGLHDLVLGMEVGAQVEDVRLDAGWGDWNPALNVSIALEALESNGLDTARIKVGTELILVNGMTALVTQRDEDAIVVDANPPLAGASYLATVKLLSVTNGPMEFDYFPDSGSNSRYQVATVALGCFWGAELAYMREHGVVGTKGMMK
jgi:FKBP-type peptidyl-prolyl cis-trans isomerase 2